MKNNVIKGLIMTVVAFLASYLSDNIEAGINWTYVLVSMFGITLVYLSKNLVFNSNSNPGKLNRNDGWSGLIMAIGTGISSFAASIISTGAVDWKALFVAMLSVVVGYFGKTLMSNSSGKVIK